jgi:ABC-2 type transport system ATP-binding protein
LSPSPPAIAVESVTKRYGDFTAVDSISFDVPPGTIFGVLGPNGAGKTTTIRMIMNITIPDEGKITILGRPSTDAAASAIGYLPEERGLYRKMKVLEHIVFLGEIRGLERATAKKRGADWLERVGLSKWADNKVEELSKGMQQKIQFIGTVIHEPEILILDEPFSGLDPVNARALKDLFLEMRDQGRTLVLCTHVMEQAEKLCDEIALINLSKLVLQGTIGDIKRQFSGNRLILRGTGEDAAISALPGVLGVARKDGALEVEIDPSLSRGEFLREAARAWSLDSAMPHEVSLDEIFVNVVGRSVGDVEAATGKEKAE